MQVLPIQALGGGWKASDDNKFLSNHRLRKGMKEPLRLSHMSMLRRRRVYLFDCLAVLLGATIFGSWSDAFVIAAVSSILGAGRMMEPVTIDQHG